MFDIPLEKVGEFSGFDDFCCTFPLTRGGKSSPDEEESEVVGEVKVNEYETVKMEIACSQAICEHSYA